MPPPPVIALAPPASEPSDAPTPSPGRALVPVRPASLPAPTAPPEQPRDVATPFRDLSLDANVRKMSPRDMAEVSMDLYATGALSWEEYAMLAFQPELHPDYERTIGALTGEKAEPDAPRDFVAQWEKRLAFEKRYNKDRPALIARTRHILNILHMLDVRARLTNRG